MMRVNHLTRMIHAEFGMDTVLSPDNIYAVLRLDGRSKEEIDTIVEMLYVFGTITY